MGQDVSSRLEFGISFPVPRRLAPAGAARLPSPGPVRLWCSDKIPADEALVSFSWGQTLLSTECSSVFWCGSFPPPPVWSKRGCFSPNIYCENSLEILEVKLIKLWGLLMTKSPWNFNLSFFSSTSLQQLVSYSSSYFTAIPSPKIFQLMSLCSRKL